MNKFLKVLKNPNSIILNLMYRGYFNFLSDKLYLKMRYRLIFGKKLNLDNPQTFNEKLQWLKIHDRKNIYTIMVDKCEVKKYIKNLSIDGLNIIPTLGLYDKFDDIDFDRLPSSFVIKCTHDSGGLVIVKDKDKLDKEKAKIKINKSLKKNYYYNGREWPYKNVKPRIIVEKYMVDKSCITMRDYKFFCFDGEPRIMYISEGLDNHKTAGISFYDMNFRITDCKRKDYRLLNYNPKKPKNFELMKEIASILSKNIPHLRVDFYEIDDCLYFGELTFFTCSGFVPFEDEKWDYKLGTFIKLNI